MAHKTNKQTKRKLANHLVSCASREKNNYYNNFYIKKKEFPQRNRKLK